MIRAAVVQVFNAVVLPAMRYVVSIFMATVVALMLVLAYVADPSELQRKQKDRSNLEATLKDPRWGTQGFIKSVDGTRLHYVEKGDRNNPMILFVHGFPEFWYQWHQQMEDLSDRYHVVAYDMRGYNDSDKPEGVENYSTEKLDEDVLQIIKTFSDGRKVYVVAHDWGGSIAGVLAREHPEYVEKLIMANTAYAPAYIGAMVSHPQQILHSLYAFFFIVDHVAEAVFAFKDSLVLEYIYGPSMSAGELELYKHGAATGALNYYRNALGSLTWQPDRKEARVTVPTYLLWGEKDKFLTKGISEGFRAHFDTIKIKYETNYSHWISHENPAFFTQFIEDSILDAAAPFKC